MSLPVVVNGRSRLTRFREKRTGSPRYSFTAGTASRAEATIWIPWSGGEGIAIAVRDILGWSFHENFGAANPYIHRENPWPHPDFPWLYAESMSEVEGEVPQGRSPNEVGAFDEGRCKVVFSPRKYRILEDNDPLIQVGGIPDESKLLRWVSFEEKGASRFQTLPGMGTLRWTSDGKPMAGNYVIILYESDIKLTWHWVPTTFYREDIAQSLVGACNQDPFGDPSTLIKQRAAQTLVFGQPDKTEVILPTGEVVYDVTLNLRYHPKTANAFYRHDCSPPGFEIATRDGTMAGSLLHPVGDFNRLFRGV